MFCGVHVDNGRIGGKMKKTLRQIIEKYNLSVRITPNQNLILCGIHHSSKEPITTALDQAGLLVKLVLPSFICMAESNFALSFKECVNLILSPLKANRKYQQTLKFS